MDGVEVNLCEFEIDADRFEGGVSEHGLEGVGVAAVAQVHDGEGVTEAVGVDVWNPCPFADGLEHGGEFGAGEGAVDAGEEEGVGGLGGGMTVCEVAPDHLSGARRDGKQAFLHPLALADEDAVVTGVEILHVEVAEFGCADASVEEQEQDGAVALERVEGVVGGASVDAIDFGSAEGGHDCFDLGLGEGDDFFCLCFGGCDFADDVGGCDLFADEP